MLGAVVSTTAVVALAAALTLPAIRDLSRREVQWIQIAVAAHVAATLLQLMLVSVLYGGQADYTSFHRHGAIVAEAIRTDFWGVAPRSLLMILQQDVQLNAPLPLDAKGGTSTAVMWSLAAWGNLLLGPSLVPTSMAAAMYSFGGKLALYRTVRPTLRVELRLPVLAAILLVPSVLYWTAGLIKEALAVGGLGFVILGLSHVTRRQLRRGVVWILVGLPMLMIKAYLLMPLTVAGAAWLFVQRASGGGRRAFRIRPLAMVASVVLVAFGMIAIGEVFPRFAIGSLADSAAQMQYYGTRATGGSTYQIGDPSTRSLLGQLEFAPIALLTAIYRPSLLDVRNPAMLLSALETTGLLAVTVWLTVRQGWRWVLGVTLRTPTLAFCVVFWLLTALGVGLISNTLGTLSRYRTPMIPFLMTTTVVLYSAPVGRRRRSWSPLPPLRVAEPAQDEDDDVAQGVAPPQAVS